MAAFSIEEWDCSEVYSRRRGTPCRPASPFSRASSPSTRSRAAAIATRLATEAVSITTPVKVSGSPSISRSHPRTTSSSSLAAGQVFQSIALTLRAPLRSSPSTPGPDPVIEK